MTDLVYTGSLYPIELPDSVVSTLIKEYASKELSNIIIRQHIDYAIKYNSFAFLYEDGTVNLRVDNYGYDFGNRSKIVDLVIRPFTSEQIDKLEHVIMDKLVEKEDERRQQIIIDERRAKIKQEMFPNR